MAQREPTEREMELAREWQDRFFLLGDHELPVLARALASYADEVRAEEREAICEILRRFAVNIGGAGKIKPLHEDNCGDVDVVRSSYIAAIRARR